MSANLALYRKYRSKDFNSVIGQASIVETLTSAINSGHLSHAYLFTGPRGVGKTTVARLLARALNCLSDSKPCNNCSQCQIDLSSSLDLIEIDAASNRRIDEIRELRDKIGLAPAYGRFKVYIIDEVHMLTTEAFNALLKTLEEPPSHAVFILATTEAHKLPDTIISRTQRFNFKPLSPTDTAIGLSQIAKQEKIDIEPEAVQLLASAAAGSLRDAISMLDQVASNGTRPITAAMVGRILGWGENQTVDQLSSALIDSETAVTLKYLDSLTNSGTSASQLIEQLINRWRHILHASVGAVSDPKDELTAKAKSQLSSIQIVQIIDQLMIASKSSWPTLALEIALVKLTSSIPTVSTKSNPPTSNVPTPNLNVQVAASTATNPPVTQAPKVQSTPKTQAPSATTEEWSKALTIIQRQNNPLYALLSTCKAVFNAEGVELICRFNFHRDRLHESRNRQLIEAALTTTHGRPLKVSARVETRVEPVTVNPSSELVSSALEILGGEVVDG